MIISCIQMNMKQNAPDENFARAAEQIEKTFAADRPDVIVLPETWNVGFAPKSTPHGLCDRDGARTADEIGALAKKLSVNIVAGSVANLKGDRLYNTAYVFDRTGTCVAEYDKTHLFSPMQEDVYYSKGEKTVDFMLDGHRCSVFICYDLRFPELFRTVTAAAPTDFLFLVSQWPAVRVPQLTALCTARAIENQCYVCCCNSCGTADGTVYGGNSAVYSPLGERQIAGAAEQVLTVACDCTVLSEVRHSINVFADRRPELYKVY